MTPTELNEGFELEKKAPGPWNWDANNPNHQLLAFLRNHALELLEAAGKVEEMEKGVTVTKEGLGELYREWFICNSCKNSMISEESNFCPNCGKKIIR